MKILSDIGRAAAVSLAFAATSFAASPAYGQGRLVLGAPVDLSGKYYWSGSDPVAVAAGRAILVMWTEDRATSERATNVVARESLDGGRSFSEPRIVPELRQNPYHFAVRGNSLFACWSEYESDSNSDQVYLIVSRDRGRTFSAPKKISRSAGASQYCRVAATSRKVHVFWTQVEGSDGRYFFDSSEDGGIGFSGPRPFLGQSVDRWSSVQTAASSDAAYVSWQDKPDSNGGRFLQGATLPDSGSGPHHERRLAPTGVIGPPSVLSTGNETLVAWGDGKNLSVARLTGGGKDLASTIQVPVKPYLSGTSGMFPSMSAVGASSVLLGWVTHASGSRQVIEIAQSIDGGRSFAAPAIVSGESEYSTGPVFAAGRTVTFAAWASWDGTRHSFSVMAYGERKMLGDGVRRVEYGAGTSFGPPSLAAVENSGVMVWLEHLSRDERKVYVRRISIGP